MNKFLFLISVIHFASVFNLKAQCNDVFNLGNDTVFCQGSTLTLDATNDFETYKWQNNSGLQPFDVTTSGTYSCTVTKVDNSTNLVTNGDFQSGNTGFTSNYTYLPIDDVTGPNAVYGVINNPQTWFNPFSPCPDHTSGSGNMMVLDGATVNATNTAFWCQDVNVLANNEYKLSYWVQSVTGAPYANIRIEVNGVSLGSDIAPNIICNWQEVDYVWSSGASTVAQICLYNMQSSGGGNDFAIDDISLNTVCEYYDEIEVVVSSPSTTSVSESICQGESILLGGGMQTSAGIYYDTLENTTCLEIIATTLSVTPSPIAIAPNDIILDAGQVLEISAENTLPGSIFEWTSSDGIIESSQSFFASPASSTSYYLTVERNGCTNMDSFSITIFDVGLEVFVPNAFSPNNDGLNDVFRIINSDEFTEIEMSIYNRWGERIFYNIDNNPSWNGKFKEVDQSQGNYIYIIKAKNASQVSISGSLSLLR